MMDLTMAYVRTYYMYLKSERNAYERFQTKAEELGISYVSMPVNIGEELRDPTVTVMVPQHKLREEVKDIGMKSYRIADIPELFELRTIEHYNFDGEED